LNTAQPPFSQVIGRTGAFCVYTPRKSTCVEVVSSDTTRIASRHGHPARDALWDVVRQDHPALPGARVTLSPKRASTNHSPDRWTLLEDGYLSGLVID